MNKDITPFIFRGASGWTLALVDGRVLEWGHRFDEGIGYRVFMKYEGAESINAFPASIARQIAHKYRNDKTDTAKQICKVLVSTAEECEQLNKIWAARGAKDSALMHDSEGGHA